jgi:hypothetical protein
LRKVDPVDAEALKNPSHTSTRDAGFSAAGQDRNLSVTDSTE